MGWRARPRRDTLGSAEPSARRVAAAACSGAPYGYEHQQDEEEQAGEGRPTAVGFRHLGAQARALALAQANNSSQQRCVCQVRHLCAPTRHADCAPFSLAVTEPSSPSSVSSQPAASRAKRRSNARALQHAHRLSGTPTWVHSAKTVAAGMAEHSFAEKGWAHGLRSGVGRGPSAGMRSVHAPPPKGRRARSAPRERTRTVSLLPPLGLLRRR